MSSSSTPLVQFELQSGLVLQLLATRGICKVGEATCHFHRNSELREQLVRMGRARGHVLYEEIDKILPSGTREAAAELDAILSELVMNSIEVMDEPRTEDSLPHAKTFDECRQLCKEGPNNH